MWLERLPRRFVPRNDVTRLPLSNKVLAFTALTSLCHCERSEAISLTLKSFLWISLWWTSVAMPSMAQPTLTASGAVAVTLCIVSSFYLSPSAQQDCFHAFEVFRRIDANGGVFGRKN